MPMKMPWSSGRSCAWQRTLRRCNVEKMQLMQPCTAYKVTCELCSRSRSRDLHNCYTACLVYNISLALQILGA